MEINISSFHPFEHENLELKNKLVALARSYGEGDSIQAVFTATLIYANLVDYLARHLLENLRKIVAINSYKQFGASCYYHPTKKSAISLGGLCNELKTGFEFNDKNDFIKLLENFNKARNKIMHNLMQVDFDIGNEEDNSEDGGRLKALKDELHEISKMAEEILTKYNAIVQGTTSIWSIVYPT